MLLATVPALVLAGAVATWVGDYIRLSRRSQLLLRSHPFSILLMIVGLFAWRVDWLLLANPAIAPLPLKNVFNIWKIGRQGTGVAEAADYLRG